MVRIMDSVGRLGWMGRGAEGEPADHGLELIGGGGGDAVQASKFLLSAASPLIHSLVKQQHFCAGCTQRVTIILPWANISAIRELVEVIHSLTVGGKFETKQDKFVPLDHMEEEESRQLQELMSHLGIGLRSQETLLQAILAKRARGKPQESKSVKSPAKGRKECWLVNKQPLQLQPHRPQPQAQQHQQHQPKHHQSQQHQQPQPSPPFIDDIQRRTGLKRKMEHAMEEDVKVLCLPPKNTRISQRMHNAIELIPSSTTKDTFFSSAPFVDNSLVKNARITNGLYLPEKDQDSRSPTYDDEDFDNCDVPEGMGISQAYDDNLEESGLSEHNDLTCGKENSEYELPEFSLEVHEKVTNAEQDFDEDALFSFPSNCFSDFSTTVPKDEIRETHGEISEDEVPTTAPERGLSCYQCGEGFDSRDKLYYHYSSFHFKKEMEKFSGIEACPICNKTLERNYSLKHIAISHSYVEEFLPTKYHVKKQKAGRPKNGVESGPVRNLACGLCQFRTPYRGSLYEHYSCVHLREQLEEKYELDNDFCPVCQKQFGHYSESGKIKFKLLAHVGAVHNGVHQFLDKKYHIKRVPKGRKKGVKKIEKTDAKHEENKDKNDMLNEEFLPSIMHAEKKKPGRPKLHMEKSDEVLVKSETYEIGRVQDLLCSICDYKTYSRGYLYEHYACIHFKKELEEKYELENGVCPMCKKKLVNCKYKLLSHIGSVHRGVEQFLEAKYHVMKKPAGRQKEGEEDKLEASIEVDPVNLSVLNDEEILPPKYHEKKKESDLPKLSTDGDGQVRCSVCIYKTDSRSHLYEHYTNRHFKKQLEEKFPVEKVCPICQKEMKQYEQESATKTKYLIHIGSFHSCVEQFLDSKYHLRGKRTEENCVKERKVIELCIKDNDSNIEDMSHKDKNSISVTCLTKSEDVQELNNLNPFYNEEKVVSPEIFDSNQISENLPQEKNQDLDAGNSNKSQLNCYLCPLSISSKNKRSDLYFHYASVHFQQEMGSFSTCKVCPICDKSLSASTALKHIAVHHSYVETFLPPEHHVKKLKRGRPSFDKTISPEANENELEKKSSAKKIKKEQKSSENSPRVKNISCSLCDHKTSSRSYLYEHYACRHFDKQITDKYEFSNGCPFCDRPLKGMNRMRWISHLGVVHSVVDEFLDVKDRLPRFFSKTDGKRLSTEANETSNISTKRLSTDSSVISNKVHVPDISPEACASLDSSLNRVDLGYTEALSCHLCKETFKSAMPSTMRSHLYGHYTFTHYKEEMKEFGDLKICPICGRPLKCSSGAFRHMGVDHSYVEKFLPPQYHVRKVKVGRPKKDSQPQIEKIEEKKQTDSDKAANKSAERFDKDKVRDFCCCLCDYKTYKRSYLYEHYAMRHFSEQIKEKYMKDTIDPENKCPICDRELKAATRDINKMVSHIGVVHNAVEVFLEDKHHIQNYKHSGRPVSGDSLDGQACQIYIDNPELEDEMEKNESILDEDADEVFIKEEPVDTLDQTEISLSSLVDNDIKLECPDTDTDDPLGEIDDPLGYKDGSVSETEDGYDRGQVDPDPMSIEVVDNLSHFRQARVVTESVIDNDNRSQDKTEIKEEPVESS